MAPDVAELLDPTERALRRALHQTFAAARESQSLEAIALALSRYDVGAVELAATSRRGVLALVLPALLAAYQAAGSAQLAELGLDGALAFDPTALPARYRSLVESTVTDIVADTDAAVRTVMMTGQGTATSAKLVALSAGLTAHRAGTLDAYRRSLLSVNPPLPAARQAASLATYASTLLGQRIDALALSLAQRALDAGQAAAVGQATAAGLLDDNAGWQIWITRDDGHVRRSHVPMHGQRRRLDEPFRSGNGYALYYPHDPGAPIAETAGCRCRRRYEYGAG